MMMNVQGRAAGLAVSQKSKLVGAVAPLRTRAAFTSSRVSVKVAASAEPSEAPAPKEKAPAPRNSGPRVQRPAPTVDLATVKPGQEFEGTVTFVKNIADLVKIGDKIKIKVLNLDAESGKIALTMKGVEQEAGSALALATAAQAERAPPAERKQSNYAERKAKKESEAEDESYNFGTGDATADAAAREMAMALSKETAVPEPLEGEVVVFSDVPGYEEIAFIMEEEDGDLNDDTLAELEAMDDVEVAFETDMPPYLTRVEARVTRIEEYGIFCEFEYEGESLSALMSKEEMKVPFVKLTEAEQGDAVAYVASAAAPQSTAAVDDDEEEMQEILIPEYVDIGDEFDINDYYAIGDSVSALILDGGLEEGRVALTHFTDADVQTDAIQMDIEGEEYGEEEVDPLAEDIEAMMLSAEEVAAIEAANDSGEEVTLGAVVGDSEDMVQEFRSLQYNVVARAAGGLFRSAVNRNTVADFSPLAFPSRPLSAMDVNTMAPFSLEEVDFDGDEMELNDYWAETVSMPKGALKKLGYKLVVSENGGVDVVEMDKPAVAEGEPAFEFESALDIYNKGDLDARVASWVADLTEPDEEEAELACRAMRRPLSSRYFAASVGPVISATMVKALRNKTGAGMMDCKKALVETEGDIEKSIEWLRKKGLSGADKKASRIATEGLVSTYIHPGSRIGVLVEVNCETDFVAASEQFQSLVSEIGMIIAASPEVTVVSPDEVSAEDLAKEREVQMGMEDLKARPEHLRAKIVEGRLDKIKNNLALLNQPSLRDNAKTVTEIVKEVIAALGENIQVRRFTRFKLGEGMEKKSNDFAAEVAAQMEAKAASEKPKPPPPAPVAVDVNKPVVQVSASLVKALREKTGAGMMDCKKALAENEANEEKAIEWLRVKGLAGADKKASRIATEGVILSYIHPGSRLGVLLEVNCETDFVAGSDKFQALVAGIAMQIAASREVAYVSAEDIPAEVFEREKLIEMGREDIKSKPEAIRLKIAEGRAKKIAADMALLDQQYLMDDTKTVGEAVKEAIVSIGEKISVRRFSKFTLGEGLEKKSNDFAAEVAAVTGAGKA